MNKRTAASVGLLIGICGVLGYIASADDPFFNTAFWRFNFAFAGVVGLVISVTMWLTSGSANNNEAKSSGDK